ncbi:hypothetical protein [Mesonia sp.]|uniref:hypothetical protein n=1 Tax=Mesonia sp. TaxID=1960830 RepID=UPI003F96B2FA
MKTIQSTLKSLFLFLLLILGFVFTSCSSDDDAPANDDAIVDSLFRDDAEGWTIVGDAQGGFVEASYSPDGGIIEGLYLRC